MDVRLEDGTIITNVPEGTTKSQLMAKLGKARAPAAPAAQPAPEQPGPTVAADVARSVPGGLGKGVAGLVGLPGDIREGAASIAKYIGGESVGNTVRTAAGMVPGFQGPTSSEYAETLAAPFGGYYQPQTTAGKYAETIASFAPAALAPGGIPARIARAVIPGATSEAAGQATEGTAAEPYARAVGALAGGGVVGAAEAIPGVRAAATKVPTPAALKSQAGQAYQAAENAGVIVAKSSFANMVKNVERSVAEAGIDKTLHPKAVAALKRLQGTKGNVTLKGVDILRRVVSGAASSIDKDERRIARIIKDQIDDYVENLTPADLVAGDATKAAPALKEARELWTKANKGDAIETLIQKAKDSSSQFSGSGYENALRTQFRNFAKNERAMRRFTAEEQAAIRKVANGGPIENTLRLFGKLSPTGVVSGGVGATLGFAIGGPPGAIAVPAAGFAARAGATAMTARNARNASEQMRRGGPAPSNALTSLPAKDAVVAAALARREREAGTYADQIRSLSQIP